MHLSLNSLYDGVRDGGGFVPVGLEPFLQLRDFSRALALNIQLDIFGQSRLGKIARTHQGLGSYNLKLRVRDVGLCVKFVLIVNTALNFARPQSIQNSWHSAKERVGNFIGLDTSIKLSFSLVLYCFQKGLPSSARRLRPH